MSLTVVTDKIRRYAQPLYDINYVMQNLDLFYGLIQLTRIDTDKQR